eukprot:237259-Chlamydomonas_euryale.AAC.7
MLNFFLSTSITSPRLSRTCTGGLANCASKPGMSFAWYAILDCENLSPCAVDTTTVRSLFPMTPRSRNLMSAASATPVCGQLNIPVRSARAAASISSSSVASSTTPSVACSARMARSIDTGSPIWIAEANVVCALTGANALFIAPISPLAAWYAWYRGLALAACATTMRGIRSTRPSSLHIWKPCKHHTSKSQISVERIHADRCPSKEDIHA